MSTKEPIVIPFALTARHVVMLGVAVILTFSMSGTSGDRGEAAPQEEPASTGTAVQKYLDRLVSTGVPGAAVVITHGDRVVVSTGAGSSVDASTRFQVASLTKSFTATAVLQLVERGRVRLDEPVVTYLPSFRTADPRSDDITVRQVLNQSSGLTDRTLGFDQYASAISTSDEAIDRLSDSTLAHDPGDEWNYCNVNYWIAQRLVEEVSGKPLERYLREHVLEPLGMLRTTLTDVPSQAHDVAEPHSYAYGQAVQLGSPDFFAGGAGGVATTADDLGRWLRFQGGHTVPGTTGSVLSGQLLQEMHRRQSPTTEYSVGYALGWWNGEPADGGVERISHSGTGPGMTAYQGLFPDDLSVGVLVSASGPRADLLANDVHALATGVDTEGPVSAPGPWRDVIATAIAVLAAVAGTRGVRRARQWAGRRGRRSRRTVLLAQLVLAMGLVTVPTWGSAVVGRQATWTVLWFTAPVPTLVLGSGVLAILAVVVARTVAMRVGRQ